MALPFAWALRNRKKLALLVATPMLPVLAHLIVGRVTRILPPSIPTPHYVASASGDVRRTAHGWTATRGIRLAYLAGTAEEIGAQHTALLEDRMAEDERIVWDGFAELVPFLPARMLMFDIGRVRYRNVADGFPDARR